jgi:hypothetical protein
MGRLWGGPQEGLVQEEPGGPAARLCGLLSAFARAACAATVQTNTGYIRFPE